MLELVIGTGLFVLVGGALLLAMQQLSMQADHIRLTHSLLYAVRGELDQLLATPLDTLWTDPQYAQARAVQEPRGQQVCLGEDVNCNGRLDLGEDRDDDQALDPSPVLNATLGVQIREADPRNVQDPALLDLHVAACWRFRGRTIGEDQNCNGRLDAGEDRNGNGWIDSPIMLSARLGRDQ